jgi:hypothetical protein
MKFQHDLSGMTCCGCSVKAGPITWCIGSGATSVLETAALSRQTQQQNIGIERRDILRNL